MDNKTKKGAAAEKEAANFLRTKGYEIITFNWRSGKKEIDIIAWQNNLLVFVEVKSRSSAKYGYPEAAVTPVKRKNIMEAASDYLLQNNLDCPIRFDIISILKIKGKPTEFLHITDAF